MAKVTGVGPGASAVERGRAPLEQDEAAALRDWMTDDEPGALAETGLSRGGLYRAGAGGRLNAGTRLAVRAALARRDA